MRLGLKKKHYNYTNIDSCQLYNQWCKPYFACSANAIAPEAKGVAALVPVKPLEHWPFRVAEY